VRRLGLAASILAGAATLFASASPAHAEPPPPDPPLAAPPGENNAGSKPSKDAKDDSGRVFEILWANAEAGFSYISLDSLNSKNLEIKNTSAAGALFGFGAGLRLLIFSLGFRARLNDSTTFTFWELDGELGIHIPAGKWDPYFGFHGGYAFVGALGESSKDITIQGGNAGLMFGADYYFLPYLSVGLDLTGDGLFLSRPPAPLPGDFKDLPPSAQKQLKSQPLYQDSGDSVGFGIAGSLHFGVHL
jgi:hypothetical protein